MTRHSFSLLSLAALLLIAVIGAVPAAAIASSRLGEFIGRVAPNELAPGADAIGPIAGDPPAATVMKGGDIVGYVFLNSDVVDSTGYSGKPISILIALDRAGHITAAKLVEHHEPIVLVGIAESRVVHFIQGYVGRSVVTQDAASTPADIVSGATVSMMVIGDSIMRSSLKVAQAYGLGGLSPQAAAVPKVKATIDLNKQDIESWNDLLGDGSVRRLFQSNHDINEAFARTGNAGAIARPETGPPDAANVDLYLALVSVPSIGRSLLGEAEYENLARRLKPGQQAVLVAGDGPYSFRGSGYVRGGIFDRIVVIQDETSIRFRDRNYTRVGELAPTDAPDFPEIGLFVIPEDVAFDPAQPWRLQLLVQRPTGAMDKAFLTLSLGYTTPGKYLTAPAAPQTASSAPLAAPVAPQQADTGAVPMWQRIWLAKIPEILILLTAIGLLTGVFFFQRMLVKHEVLYQRIRLSYLAFTLLWLGWYEHAQLSVVNIFTFFQALRTDFHWDLFLMDPLVFILWCSVAAALLFWGRGAYCGWLCPFGALQEWMSFIAKACRIPQLTLPFGLHERLWPIKYIIFLALFGVSLGSLATAEQLAEIEPFKTAIILHFARDWWFVLLALGLLAPGLFIDRFYCRYMCPLGGALAVPARIRMFDWLRRYRQCGSPCQRCYNECPVQAIHPEGHINPNECIQCLNCQVLYHHDGKCPVMIEKRLKRERFAALSSQSMKPGAPAAAPAKAKNVTKRAPAAPASAQRP